MTIDKLYQLFNVNDTRMNKSKQLSNKVFSGSFLFFLLAKPHIFSMASTVLFNIFDLVLVTQCVFAINLNLAE